MIDHSSAPEDGATGSRNPQTTSGPDGMPGSDEIQEELLGEARDIIQGLINRVEESIETKGFDPGLPLEPEFIRALACILRKDAAEYNRVWEKLKNAKPAPDLTLLKSRIKSEAKIQDAKERLANTSDYELDAVYNTASGLMSNMKDYEINEFGGLSKIDFETLYDNTTGQTILIPIDKPICDFVAWPTREILKDNGVSKERYIELEGVLPDAYRLPKVTVSIAEFQEMKWPSLFWGMRVAIRPFKEKELKYCLEKMSQSGIPESVVYTSLGWKEVDGKWIYLHAGGAIGAENVEIELPAKLSNYRLPEKITDLKSAIKAAIDLFDIGPATIMYPLASMAFLSPLMEAFRQADIEPGVLLYLWGSSGSRKSTIIALVLCFFGSFDNKTLPASFRDTAMSIELMAFIAKDTLLPVDDLYPAQDPKEQQKLIGVLEYIMRNQGDRQGRTRLASGESDYTLSGGHPPRGLIVASGEVQALRGSSLARAYARHICTSDLDNTKLQAAQSKRDLLGQAMVGYLEWLAPQLDELPAMLASRFEELRERARTDAKVQGRHGRLNDAIAHMYIGLEMFFEYAVDSGAITKEEAEVHLAKGGEALNQGADEQTNTAQKSDPSQVFVQAILELEAQHKVCFASMDGTVSLEQKIGSQRQELIGWGPDQNGAYYIMMDAAIKAANELLRGLGENIVLRKDLLLDGFEHSGLLATPHGKDRSYSKTIDKKTRYVTAVKAQAFDLEVKKEQEEDQF